MKKLLSGLIIVGLVVLVPGLFLFQTQIANNLQLAWATFFICGLGLLIIAICMNIKEQVDDNPYYVQMIKAKKELVHLYQKRSKEQ